METVGEEVALRDVSLSNNASWWEPSLRCSADAAQEVGPGGGQLAVGGQQRLRRELLEPAVRVAVIARCQREGLAQPIVEHALPVRLDPQPVAANASLRREDRFLESSGASTSSAGRCGSDNRGAAGLAMPPYGGLWGVVLPHGAMARCGAGAPVELGP